MKRSILLIVATIFFMAGGIFAGSIATQRVVNAYGFIKGSTTLDLSGQMNPAAMQSISDGNPMAIYNSLDSYLAFPTLLPATKAGYGEKTGTRNVFVKTKNGKFQWTEKDVTPYFTFVTGEERIRPDKAVLKSKGTIDSSNLAELETKRLTVFDKLCADQSMGNLASLAFTLQQKGKNYKLSYNKNDLQAKVSVDSKGRVTAKYTLSPEAAYPAILESEYIFTNTYDYSLEIIGDGDVYSGYYGPDQVEFKVTRNVDKFRYFLYKGAKATNDFLTLELLADTEVTAVFGTYDLSINVIGDGAVSADFTGPDEVEIKVIEGGEGFLYYTVNGEQYLDSAILLSLQKDTVIEAYFKNDYIVIDLSAGPNAESYPVTHVYDVPEGGWTDEYKTTKMVLRKIKAGKFTMGSPTDELGRSNDETQHRVTLTKAYYIGVFEVTQKQYELIMGRNPSYYKGDMRPVEYVSYDTLRGSYYGSAWPASYDVDETSFFGKLRAKTNMVFDLPTEAQWEYACRAGTTTALNSGKNLTSEDKCPNMAEVGRYYYNKNDGKGGYSEHTTVGSYKPNAWGLYDMHGNVYEWCLDWYQSDIGYPANDPKGADSGTYRVLRGGSWSLDARYCRSADRSYFYPGYGGDGNHGRGFRVALVQ